MTISYSRGNIVRQPIIKRTTLLATAIASLILGSVQVQAQGAGQNTSQSLQLAQAQATQTFAIPAQALTSALDQFSEQTGIAFAYSSGELTGIQSPAVEGELTPRQALNALLAGTGVNARFSGGDTVTLSRPAEQDGAMMLGPIRVGGETDSSDKPQPGAVRPQIGRLGIENKRLPATVTTVNEEDLKKLPSLRSRDLSFYLPGVNAFHSNGDSGELLTIRGFQLTTPRFVNGMADDQTNTVYPLELVGRIEVLKGPSSIEFGVVAPGGGVNFVTKKPEREAAHSVDLEFDQHGHQQVVFDSTGALPDTENLYYRTVVLAADTDSFRDNVDYKTFAVLSSLEWAYSDTGSLLVEPSYRYSDKAYDRGIAYMDGQFQDREFNWHHPDDEMPDSVWSLHSRWEDHLFGPVSARVSANYWLNKFASRGLRNRGPWGLVDNDSGEPQSDATVVEDSWHNWTNEQSGWVVQPELLFDYATGPLQHRTIVGLSYRDKEALQEGQDGFDIWRLDYTNPSYPSEPDAYKPWPDASDATRLPSGARDYVSSQDNRSRGLFLQHALEWERLTVTAGLRQERYEETSAWTSNRRQQAVDEVARDGFEDTVKSHRLGASYELIDNVFVFTGYSTATTPQSRSVDYNAGITEPANPLEGKSIEAGIKFTPRGDSLLLSASFFDISEENILVWRETSDGNWFQEFAGANTVRGMELEAQGQVTRNLELRTGVTYLDSEIESEDATNGNRFNSVPEWSASAYATFDTSEYLLSGLSLSAGIVHEGSKYISNGNQAEMPSFLRLDFSASYERGPWDLSLGVENIADETYYVGSQNRVTNITPGAPRTAYVSLTRKF